MEEGELINTFCNYNDNISVQNLLNNIDIIDKNNLLSIINTGDFRLLLFYSTHCHYCQSLIPIFKRLSSLDGSFGMVNIGNRRFITMFKNTLTPIGFVPYMVLFINGEPYKVYKGPYIESEIIEFVKNVHFSKEDVKDNNFNFIEQLTNKFKNFKIKLKLDLSRLGLKIIPEKIFELTNLYELNLCENLLENIPINICKLTNLKRLELCGNKFKKIPLILCDLQNLETLYIFDCKNDAFYLERKRTIFILYFVICKSYILKKLKYKI
jgi:thiol-disulfide isomerase/thioredoxin